MNDFGINQIIFILFTIPIFYVFHKRVNRKKYLGNILYKIKQDYDSTVTTVTWIVIAIILALVLILRGREILDVITPNTMTAFIIVALAICTNGMLKGISHKELRDRGLIDKGKYFYWKNLKDHEWIEDRVEINFQTSRNKKKTKTVIWFVKDEDMEKIEEILKEKGQLNK